MSRSHGYNCGVQVIGRLGESMRAVDALGSFLLVGPDLSGRRRPASVPASDDDVAAIHPGTGSRPALLTGAPILGSTEAARDLA